MTRQQPNGDVIHTVRQALTSARDWHDRRPRAQLGSLRGLLWSALIAAAFFWMSNPLVFVPGFHLSLSKTLFWTSVVVLVTLPWIRLPRMPWPWVAFHGLCYLSLLWTIDPHVTGYSSILYLKITLVAVVIAANCEPLVVCWGLALGGVAVVALSLYAFHQEMWGASNAAIGGALITGVGANENILAYTLVLSLAAILAAGLPRHLAARGAWLVVLGANAYGLYLAQSGSGFLTALSGLLALGIALAWPVLRTKPQRGLVVGVGAAVCVLVVGLVLIVVVLGKDLSSFSGRSPFWRAAFEATMDRSPFVGSGWGAVWQHPWSLVPPNEVAEDIYTRAGYPLSHGHNLFIDVLPELGLLGVAVALLMIGYAAREATRSGPHESTPDPVAGRLTLLVLVALLVFGITEPMLTVPLGWWSLTLVAALTRQRVQKHDAPRSALAGRRAHRRGVATSPDLTPAPAP